jgi:phosphoglycerol transferase
VSGVGDIEPGFGRWSDADIADHVEVLLAEPIAQPVTLEIRARGVGVNVGAPVVIQIGDEQQSVVLTETVATYQLTFTRGRGEVIAIYPQPVMTPPPGDSRRIGVFMQSIRVVNP